MLQGYLAHFSAQAPKYKKILPEKNSLYFGKWNFLSTRLKNVLYFLKKVSRTFQPKLEKIKNFLALILKNFLYFLERKLFLYFWKWNPALSDPSPQIPGLKKFLMFSQKSPQFFGNSNPEKILMLQEMELFYISGSNFRYNEAKFSKLKYFLIIII